MFQFCRKIIKKIDKKYRIICHNVLLYIHTEDVRRTNAKIYYKIYTCTKEIIKYKRYKCVSGTVTNDIINIRDVSVQKIDIDKRDSYKI